MASQHYYCRYAGNLSNQNLSVLYVSGEESLHQIKIRAERIGTFTDSLELLCETNLDTIRSVIERKKPQIVIIDSIQTMYNESVGSAPGSVSQVRESTGVLMQIDWNFYFYCRTCDEGRCSSRPAFTGAYGGYGVVF